jgi:hypothetical protein
LTELWGKIKPIPALSTALLILCDLFGCDLDTLLRGNAADAIADDTAGYHKHMNGFTMATCGGTTLVLLGVSVLFLLMAQNLPDALAVMILLSFVLISAAVFIVSSLRHGDYVRKHPQIKPFHPQKQIDAFDRRFPFFIAVPTVLLLLGIITLLGLEVFPRPASMSAGTFEALFLSSFMALLAFSVPLYISGGMQKAKYNIARHNLENAPTEDNKRKT